MNSYLIIEDMKFEAMNEFKQTWPHRSMWSNFSKYKLRICVTFDEYDKIQKLRGQKDISFTFKNKNGEFLTGYFNLDSTLGVSGYKWGRIIDIHLSELESEKAPKDFCRDLLLNELLG